MSSLSKIVFLFLFATAASKACDSCSEEKIDLPFFYGGNVGVLEGPVTKAVVKFDSNTNVFFGNTGVWSQYRSEFDTDFLKVKVWSDGFYLSTSTNHSMYAEYVWIRIPCGVTSVVVSGTKVNVPEVGQSNSSWLDDSAAAVVKADVVISAMEIDRKAYTWMQITEWTGDLAGGVGGIHRFITLNFGEKDETPALAAGGGPGF